MSTLQVGPDLYERLVLEQAIPSSQRISIHFREDSPDEELLEPLRQFLRKWPEWSVIQRDEVEEGNLIISRDPQDRRVFPSLARQALNFLGSSIQHILHGCPVADDAEVQRRLDICILCPNQQDGRCLICGCYLVKMPNGSAGKVYYADEECDIHKWRKYDKID